VEGEGLRPGASDDNARAEEETNSFVSKKEVTGDEEGIISARGQGGEEVNWGVRIGDDERESEFVAFAGSNINGSTGDAEGEGE
jgi:hypothetical protein